MRAADLKLDLYEILDGIAYGNDERVEKALDSLRSVLRWSRDKIVRVDEDDGVITVKDGIEISTITIRELPFTHKYLWTPHA